ESRVKFVGLEDAAKVEEVACVCDVVSFHHLVGAVKAVDEHSSSRMLKHSCFASALCRKPQALKQSVKLSKGDRRSFWHLAPVRVEELPIVVIGRDDPEPVERSARTQQVARMNGFVIAVVAEEEPAFRILPMFKHAAFRNALLDEPEFLEVIAELSVRDRPHL